MKKKERNERRERRRARGRGSLSVSFHRIRIHVHTCIWEPGEQSTPRNRVFVERRRKNDDAHTYTRLPTRIQNKRCTHRTSRQWKRKRQPYRYRYTRYIQQTHVCMLDWSERPKPKIHHHRRKSSSSARIVHAIVRHSIYSHSLVPSLSRTLFAVGTIRIWLLVFLLLFHG